jgi:hypothetical protein
MRRYLLTVLLMMLALAAFTRAAAAANETDYKAALAAAEDANKQAGTLKNQWTTTADAIKAAKKAADAKDFDKATALAKQAGALAKASIDQAHEQETAWKATAAGLIR